MKTARHQACPSSLPQAFGRLMDVTLLPQQQQQCSAGSWELLDQMLTSNDERAHLCILEASDDDGTESESHEDYDQWDDDDGMWEQSSLHTLNRHRAKQTLVIKTCTLVWERTRTSLKGIRL
jgi:hypothetical protein